MAQLDAVPIAYPESPSLEQEDTICKGCGDILEEGKAFELAGNRWHIQCFRCHSCGALLDSDANLLLLGDGSLICNNCTYSCSACGNKIEDLAILTGDQAFCSSCFRCRNCKKKIENLRYARTSQGIFCMSCHETLMARRRKKSRAAAKPGQPGQKEKALPSLPPGAAVQSALSPDLPELETPPTTSQAGTPAAMSPPQRQDSRKELQAGDLTRGASSYSDDSRKGVSARGELSYPSTTTDAIPDGPILPASTYGEPRPSNASRDSEDGLERGFLPMAFDPTPSSGPPTITRKAVPSSADPSPQQGDQRSRDYFGKFPAKSSHRDALREDQRPGSARSASTEREPERTGSQPKPSPHILSQDKGRYNKTSEITTPGSLSAAASPVAGAVPERTQPPQFVGRDVNQSEGFKLQDVPESKKTSLRGSKGPLSPALTSPSELEAKNDVVEKLGSPTPSSADSPGSGINPFDDPKLKEGSWPGTINRPVRGDSLASAMQKAVTPTQDTQTPTAATSHLQTTLDRQGSVSSVPSSFVDAQESLSRDNSVSRPLASPAVQSSPEAPPPRASSRQNRTLADGEFTAPRPPPAPPATAPLERHRRNESTSTAPSADVRSDDASAISQYSAGLPKQSMDAPFSMEEEMARILRGDSTKPKAGPEAPASSALRKVSNAVKHGRSFSDRALSSVSKSPANGGLDNSSPLTISSPLLSSPIGRDTNEQLAAQLKRAQARIAELETDVSRLQEKVNSSTEIKAANNELREKRTTMVVLDTQRELVVRELETMTEHLTRAKESNQPLDWNMLKTEILKDFGDALQKLKTQMAAQIEDLMHKRNELTEEIRNLIQMKDKGFQEFETLSNKNAQLQEMNNQILLNIQDMYKSNRAVNGSSSTPTANGLGIYHAGAKIETPGPTEVRNLNLINTDSSMPNLLQETEAEPATVLTAPQVVNIRKGQPKKFNWRKGGERVAKNVTKGIKGAFASDRMTPLGESPYGIGMPYNQMQAQAAPSSDQGSILSGKQGIDPSRSGSSFGLFGQKPGGLKVGGMGGIRDNSSTNLVDPSVLFGSELSDRCEYEKRVIPGIVSRCIEEVESRGIDMEGIYRKSGGSGQVKIVQQGFEKDNNYDISDPDLDIHAVTSALKQYLRKLPNPLITYDVYDGLLDAGRIQDKEKQAVSLRMLVAELPGPHRDCLEYLVQHLARVMANESDNLMTPLNLSVVFAPTIMRPDTIEREMSDMQAQRVAVQALLEQHAALFPDD